MSMTKSDATKVIEGHIQFLKENWKPHPDYNVIEALKEAIYTIEEIQQYRAIGTVDDVAFYKKCYDEESYEYCGEYGTDSCGCKDRMEYLEKKIAEFEAIGTVSEFRELKEKATAKESYGIKCPHCNFYTINGRYCCNCGKMLVAKSEGKE